MKIQHIINQFFEEAENREEAFDRNKALTDQLIDCGPRVVDPVLNKLFARKQAGELYDVWEMGSPVFHLISVVNKLAQPQHALQLAEMLLWPEIVFEEDRSKRDNLLKALERIGTSEVTPLLEEYAERVKQVPYSCYEDLLGRDFIPASQYHQWDQEEVAAVIAVCQERHPSLLTRLKSWQPLQWLYRFSLKAL